MFSIRRDRNIIFVQILPTIQHNTSQHIAYQSSPIKLITNAGGMCNVEILHTV